MEHIDEVVRLERELRSELGAFGEEVVVTDSDNTAPSPSKLDHQCRQVEQQSRTKNSSDKSPLLLRPGWQERLFSYARRSFSHSSRDPSHADSPDEDDADHDTLTLLRTLQPTILSLWNDDSRCRTLRCRNLFLDSQADAATTYFLDALPRIVSPSYSRLTRTSSTLASEPSVSPRAPFASTVRSRTASTTSVDLAHNVPPGHHSWTMSTASSS